MTNHPKKHEELHDWIDALENLILFNGNNDAKELLTQFFSHVANKGLLDESFKELPFENTISKDEEFEHPGDLEIEKKIRHYIRWNALVSVLKANKKGEFFGIIS